MLEAKVHLTKQTRATAMAKEGNNCRLSIGIGKLELLRSRSLFADLRHWEGSQRLGRHPRI